MSRVETRVLAKHIRGCVVEMFEELKGVERNSEKMVIIVALKGCE